MPGGLVGIVFELPIWHVAKRSSFRTREPPEILQTVQSTVLLYMSGADYHAVTCGSFHMSVLWQQSREGLSVNTLLDKSLLSDACSNANRTSGCVD